jgi:hypothetical protein
MTTPSSDLEASSRADGGRPGLLPALVGFGGGWLAGYVVARVVARLVLAGSDLEGFSGLAVALSVAVPADRDPGARPDR